MPRRAKKLDGLLPDKPITDTYPNEAFRIRSHATLVHIARAAIVSNLDLNETVNLLFPYDKPERKAKTLELFESSEDLKKEVTEQLKLMDLGDTSKEAYIKEMFIWLWGPNPDLAQTAARLLGKAFMPEKINDKPAVLQIKGMEEGLKTMFGDGPAANIDSGTGFDNPDNEGAN